MKKLAILCICAGIVLAFKSGDKDRMCLKYDRPAEYFEEALPLGNGRLGAMVYGGTSVDRISLNDITLWTGEPDRGAEHPDYSLVETLTPWGESAEWMDDVRFALDNEDYEEADRLQKHIQGHYSENYQPLGTLEIVYPDGEITDYRRSLDISRATAEVTYKRNGNNFCAKYFVSSPDSVIVIHLRSETHIDAEIKLGSLLPHSTIAQNCLLISDGYAAWHSYPKDYRNPKERFMYDPDRGIHYRTVVRCDDAVASDSTLRISGVKETTIYITNATSFAGFDRDPVKEGREYKNEPLRNSKEASELGLRKLRRRHLNVYTELFDRVSIDLGKTDKNIRQLATDQQLLRYADGEQNPELEALYFQYGRYLLISSSRTPGIPANLQGIWNEHILPPWSSNYTVNINLEENYWAAEAAALPEMHESLLSFIGNLSQNGKVSARNYYGIERGWSLSHNSDVWAMTCPVGLGTGNPCWANWSFGGAWLSTHIWEHWLFTRDLDALKKYYPMLKGAAEFSIDFLVEKNGELIPSPTTSPENIYLTPEGYKGKSLYGSTSDIAIIRECLTDALAAAEMLEDEAFVLEVTKVLSRLRGYHVGENGALQEWYHDWKDRDPRHRHQSHLIGVYPGHQIKAGTELAEAALKTLEIKGFETTGWSCGWRINLYARLGDAESAYKMYRRLLRYVSPDAYRGDDARRGGGTYPNLFDAHSPFQIDGNFGGCAGVIEMLVQSTPDTVTPLPALPSAWPNGSIKGIRTRTGQTVDLVWKNGKVKTFKCR